MDDAEPHRLRYVARGAGARAKILCVWRTFDTATQRVRCATARVIARSSTLLPQIAQISTLPAHRHEIPFPAAAGRALRRPRARAPRLPRRSSACFRSSSDSVFIPHNRHWDLPLLHSSDSMGEACSRTAPASSTRCAPFHFSRSFESGVSPRRLPCCRAHPRPPAQWTLENFDLQPNPPVDPPSLSLYLSPAAPEDEPWGWGRAASFKLTMLNTDPAASLSPRKRRRSTTSPPSSTTGASPSLRLSHSRDSQSALSTSTQSIYPPPPPLTRPPAARPRP